MKQTLVTPMRGGNSIGRYYYISRLLHILLISHFCTTRTTTAANEIDQESILLRFFDTTNGLKWRTRTNWLSDSVSLCEWYGVICYSDEEVDDNPSLEGKVKGLSFRDNKLSGIPPTEIFSLPYLRTLDLRDNLDMDFSFDGIENAKMLEELALSATGLTSLSGIGKASDTLKQLHLTDNKLTGPIPDEIFSLTGLHRLFMNYNAFSGTLSPKIGNLKKIHELFLYDNELTGQIPSEIGALTELTILALSENSLGGTLPSILNDFEHLEILALQHQRRKGGRGISGSLLDFASSVSLRELYLSDNHLTGSIPIEFLKNNANIHEVVKVDLANNMITGMVPPTLARFERMKLYLANNQIRGVAQDLCEIKDWMGGDVQDFGCMGILCPIGYFNEGGRQTKEDSPCQQCPRNSEAQYLGATECVSMDEQDLTQRDILEHFYEATNGHFWKNRENWLSQTIDECGWYGVTCTGQMVTGLSLPNNELSGAPPTDLFLISSLKSIDLSGNFINFSFEGIGNATKLTTLILSSTGLSSLEGIKHAKSLVTLDLSSNALTGPLHDKIFELINLQHLDLSHNSFTGTLPSSVGDAVNLQGLHCYGCSLSGPLPSTLGQLTDLRKLDLPENDFTGTIPTAIDLLTKLNTLSLHQNTRPGPGLTGTLPEFQNLVQLTQLYLEGNRLTGTIPSTLLKNSKVARDERIVLGLSDNSLEGSIPEDLSRFSQLNIGLTDNKITAIPDSLCQEGGWMDGWVETFGCDAILCPKGTHNKFGRQTADTFDCGPCNNNAMAPFYGTTKCLFDSEEDKLNERDILEKFYFITGGPTWNVKTNWLNDFVNICEWHGVVCYHKEDMKEHVRALILRDNGLEGAPPMEIFQMPYLQELNLHGNSLNKMSFTGIENATYLRNLTLSEAGLTSLEGIGKAPALKSLHLTENYMTGTIPEEVFDLVGLEELYLNFNRFSGRLSSKIGNLVNLKELFLFHNRLTGQIPASIGNLKNIKLLTLAKNKLTGTLPEELNELKTVEILSLEGNGVDDGIKGKMLDFSSLPQLQQLFLNYNSLTGTIPTNFLSGISDKFSDVKVDLIHNKLSGKIPNSLASFQKMHLFVAGNEISDLGSELCMKEEWMNGNVGEWGCDAILCPPNTFAKFGRRSSGDDDGKSNNDNNICAACPSGTVAPFYGSMDCISDNSQKELQEKYILEEFFVALNGPNWSINANWLNNEVSICKWHGVTCSSSKDGSVEAIHLSRNGLEGTVPSSVFKLPLLQELNLAENFISFSFDGIENAPKLEYLNLDNTGLQSLDGIENGKALNLLHLMNNDFDGSIPQNLFQLTNLEVLFLSSNSFNGEFPEDMRRLSKLRFLSAFDCGLSGVIPEWIGDLTSLEYLRLDQNSFSGTIPFAISKDLINLEHLDISDQRSAGGKGLSGPLPDFSGMKALTEIILSGNALTGQIPSSLMEKADLDSVITIDLRDNKFEGHVPTHLNKFDDVKLYLAGNMISQMSDDLCGSDQHGNSLWLNGDVANFGCDGLMCPPGTFNEEGRQTDANEPCRECNDQDSSAYFGSTHCSRAPGGDLDYGDEADTRKILSSFFLKCGGAIWKHDNNWLSDKSVCEWYGIHCYDDSSDPLLKGHVRKIDLHNNKLHDVPPKELFRLPYLQELNLKSNPIQFNFTGLKHATSLKTLILSETGITSVEGIGEAPALEVLHLTNNDIKGTIPDSIFDIITLKQLYLNYNQLEGPISSRIGNLKNMEELYLFHNSLTGQLPSELGSLSSLRLLALSMNHFDGTLPLELGNLENLEILSLQREGVFVDAESDEHVTVDHNDKLRAGISGPLLDFSKMTHLKELYLGSNQITGTIPSNFLANIQDKSQKIKIDLTMNKISGTVPTTLSSYDNMNLYLVGNQIDTVPKQLCQQNDWMSSEVKTFHCDAILCPPGTSNEYGRQSTPDTPCRPCDVNEDGGVSEYYGSLDCLSSSGRNKDLKEIDILTMFFHATGGTAWDDNYQWLSTDVPYCEWHGITCSSDGQKVTKIELPSNELAGTPPKELYQLPSLTVLDLHGNKNLDFIFHGIGSASQLKELNLASTKIKSLTGIGGAAQTLRVLNIQNNDFGGQKLPEQLTDLVRLKYLYLSNNRFVGPLPRSIGNLHRLEEMYCTQNNFSGTIPTSVGNLDQLRVLALSENDFTGTLPKELNQLPRLSQLYIDNFTRRSNDKKGLTGPLLDFSNLPYLTDLYLGYNSLTGTIPSTFLASIKDPMIVTKIGLNSNQLTGTIPFSLGKFKRLDIDVAGNKIKSIPDDLCRMDEWMSGNVRKFKCDAILCPPGTFNLHGRQSTPSQPCRKCEKFPLEYYGSMECGSEEKEKEKAILVKTYHTLNGDSWKRKDDWLNDDVDYCEWYGISCDVNNRIESILLGSNNLQGTPPKDIFQIAKLKYLWLYSNPIDFRFDGIQYATQLSSLLLDSTGLKSIKNIDQATNLVEVDLRFNQLKGTIPDELFQLHKLESLSLSENEFTGSIPSSSQFAKLYNIKKLRLGSNKLTGQLPDFKELSFLKSIDLSNNHITGSIPTTFLNSSIVVKDMFIDLSSNLLTGTVPGSLSKFEHLTIYLRGNQMTGIDPRLCSQTYWNDGDVADFGCDGIMCPQGSFSRVGRQSKRTIECETCPSNEYAGSTTCREKGEFDTVMASDASSRRRWGVVVVASSLLSFFTCNYS